MFCVCAGQRGAWGWCFHYIGLSASGLVDSGFVPGVCGGVGGGEDAGLEGAASGGEGDAVVAVGESDSADAVEFSQCPGGGEVLVGPVGVCDAGCGEVACDEGFRDGGVDADGDVAADALFGPVAYGPQPLRCI